VRRGRSFGLLLGLGLGTAGGYGAFLAGLPLAWMIGSMVTTTIAAAAGAPIAMAPGLRLVMVAVLGVMLGSGFTPEMLAAFGRWGVSLACLPPFIVLATTCGYLYFRRLCGHDRVTAYFAATPGGLNEMILVGSEMGGDGRVISLVHAARILMVVLVIPIGFRLLEDLDGGRATIAGMPLAEIPLGDLGLLALCGLAGFTLARAIKLPAAAVVGPMLLSAGVHLAGLTTAAPPRELIAAAQVVIGAAIGARFAGTAFAFIRRILIQAAGSTLMLVALTLAFALALHALLGFDRAALILAFSPGGLAEMSLIAIALGLETAFVALHHIVRIFLVVVFAPLFFRFARRRD
jgi:membrane AbrB-like protein